MQNTKPSAALFAQGIFQLPQPTKQCSLSVAYTDQDGAIPLARTREALAAPSSGG